MLSINRALYNFKILKKHKSEKLKKEIIYYSSEKGKVDFCMKLHKIHLDQPNAYLLFINVNTDEICKIKSEIKGKEITPDNYSKFVNYEKIIKEFEISNDEIDNDLGIIGAVYNRIAIKDLK
jgi:hypothetical protein